VIAAEMLKRRIKDPRLGFVTLTDVRLTGDSRDASVFYTAFGTPDVTAGALKLGASRVLNKPFNMQDLEGIDRLSQKDETGINGYMDLLLYDRNRKWARELDGLLGQKSLLIAVGAAHLPGVNGVIELLRKEGYTLEPVNNNFPGNDSPGKNKAPNGSQSI